MLSQRLRTADPFSKKFSKTKYGEHSEKVKADARRALEKHIYKLVAALIVDFEKTDAAYQKQIEKVAQAIENSEGRQQEQSIRLWNELNVARDARTETLLTSLQKILTTLKDNQGEPE